MSRKTTDATKLLKIYEAMVRIRKFEEKICAVYPRQNMRTPVHLCIGQEAVPAAFCAALKTKDRVFGTHRSHGLYIAKGGDLRALAAELYGKKKGCSGGKGGSMHIIAPSKGVSGTTAIVGGNIPMAVGSAMASLLREENRVSCAFFGDGAVDEGVFYESMNFAALKKLPVIFICENNFYAVHSHLSQRQLSDNISLRGRCLGVDGMSIDGNDASEVYTAAKQAVFKARSGEGPSLIECRTYRFKTHVGPETDIELGFPPGRCLGEWMKRDPVKLLRKLLLKRGVLTPLEDKSMVRRVNDAVEDAFKRAESYSEVEEQDLYRDVLCNVSPPRPGHKSA